MCGNQLSLQSGLFSAINAGFVSLSLSNLTGNPIDQTNDLLRFLVMRMDNSTLASSDLYSPTVVLPSAIRQNCFFFASLCCSLQAAAGAILARQWLQFYSRTGQTGSLETQARVWTNKTEGAVRWRLETVIEILPTLLQLSLTLFYAGLIDFLWQISRTVAGVVMAFTFVGVLLFSFSVIASVISPQCPYRTGITHWVSSILSFVSLVWWLILYFGWLLRHWTASLHLPLRRLLLRRGSHREESPLHGTKPVLCIDILSNLTVY